MALWHPWHTWYKKRDEIDLSSNLSSQQLLMGFIRWAQWEITGEGQTGNLMLAKYPHGIQGRKSWWQVPKQCIYSRVFYYNCTLLITKKFMVFPTTPNSRKVVEQQELCHCWWKCKIRPFGSLTKHTFITQSENHVLWYLPKEVNNLCLLKIPRLDVALLIIAKT